MKRTTSGFTLVELLVVISIIGVLMALLIPAVNAAREVARRNTCATQIKNLALAATLHNSAKNRLPGYVEKYGVFPGAAVDPSDPKNFGGIVRRHIKVGTWAVALLPHLDAQPTYEHWTEDRYPIRADGAGDLGKTSGVAGDGFHTLAAPNLAILQCPSNPVSAGDYGKNSYVPNNGFTPYLAAASGAPTLVTGTTFASSQSASNGAFNCKYNVPSSSTSTLTRTGEGPNVKLDDFKDGQGNTILFSENLQALPWHRPGLIDGAALDVTGTATDVAFSNESARYIHGMVWHYEDPNYADTSLTMLWNKNGTANAVVPTDVNSFHLINGGGTTVSEEKFTKTIQNLNDARNLARPSSAHVDGVNAGLADGATRFITDSIDYRVYQALLTPRGKSSNVPYPEFILTDDAY